MLDTRFVLFLSEEIESFLDENENQNTSKNQTRYFLVQILFESERECYTRTRGIFARVQLHLKVFIVSEIYLYFCVISDSVYNKQIMLEDSLVRAYDTKTRE